METEKRVKKVLPCPFCGGTSIFATSKEFYNLLCKEYEDRPTKPMMSIECTDCNLEMKDYQDNGTYQKRLNDLKNRWNTRVKED